MTPATSNILDRGMTEQEARANLARRDRQSWFRGTHASGDFGIISGRDGREVARSHTQGDREQIILMAKSHDALVAALSELLEQIECLGGVEYCRDIEPYKAEACWEGALTNAQSALKNARGAVPLKTTDEMASTPGACK